MRKIWLVDRYEYILNKCNWKNVLDLWCVDHDFLIHSKDKDHPWLHKNIKKVAKTCYFDPQTLSYLAKINWYEIVDIKFTKLYKKRHRWVSWFTYIRKFWSQWFIITLKIWK